MDIILRQITKSGGVMERGVVLDVHQQSCVLCFREIETASHLFASCPKTRVIQGAYL